jgi:ATP-dependent helicase HrpA
VGDEQERPGTDGPRRARRGPARTRGAAPRGRSGRAPAEAHTPHAAARRARLAEARRAVVVPPITYPEELPVSARRAEIAAAIRDHQVVIVSGETGSGKTTQLPKLLLELGRGREGQIGHTQPRRIAARTVAERISEEITGGPGALGTIVGYQVRFTDQSSEQTLVKVMTDGILLAQIQRDPKLLAYDTLVIDEAHERSLNIDFILGYLRRLLPQRPDLKVVITSATIDSARFARHFGAPPSPEHPDGVPAPVVEVTGRTYPVEIRYRPLSPDDEPPPDDADDDLDPAPRRATAGEERDLMTAICEAVDELCAEGPGDVLVFLSGEREIRDAEDALRAHLGPRATDPRTPGAVEILPLYARLSSAEQHRVFEPHTTRRVVLATNVAETSLTVPGVRYVVDPGTARISRWSKATKVQRLPIERISQASADQRSGRCGRVADGIAIRLYSRADLESRPEFTEPEILRTSLASVILQMVAVGVAATPDDVARFPFVDPPDVRAVRDGVQLLTELGALETLPGGRTRLTDVGRALAQLPIDPRLGRMIVEAGRRDCAREVMIVAAALSIQDPRERPADQREVADAAHARFADPTSDFLTYLNLWTYLREKQRELSGNQFRRLCRAEFLNYLRVREWQDVVAQLRELARPLGITVRPPARTGPSSGATADAERLDGDPPLRREWDADRIHQAILAGLLSHLGMQEATEVRAGARPARRERTERRPQARNEYLGARGARFAIFPGSALARKPPSWVMAGELVETSRLWARDVARVQPEWAEELGAHLVKRTYSEPTWSAKQGAAVATERVLLYGLPIVAGRRVLYAKVDPEHARELFIRHALVEGEWTTHHAFFARNRALLEEAEQLEHRARRRGLVADEDALFGFYDERVPAGVVSARHFDRWWKEARRADPALLDFSLEMLVGDAEVDEARFPSVWPQGDLELALTYRFDPGAEHDGITVDIPLAVLPRVRPEGFDRLVPGLQEELVVALIRSLPKALRVPLVPAPDAARELVAWIEANEPAWADAVRAADMAPSFATVLSRAARAVRGVEVPDDAWDASRLPPHLRVRFRAVEQRGRQVQVVDEADDLVVLQHRLAARAEDAVRTAVRSAVRDAMREAASGAGAGAAAGSGSGGPGGSAGAPAGDRLGHAERSGARAGGGPRRPAPRTSLERSDLSTWPEGVPGGRIPDVVETVAAGMPVRAWPALVVGGTDTGAKVPAARSVALRVLATEAEQRLAHGAGVRELLLRDVGLATARITTRWTSAESLALAAHPYPTTDALVADLQRAAVDAVATERGVDLVTVRDADAYAALRAHLRDDGALEQRTYDVARTVVGVLSAARELDADLRATTSLALLATVHDIRGQLAGLVHDGFVVEAGAARLPHLVRYLRAARYRLGKAAENLARDESLAWQVDEATQEYEDAVAAARAAAPDADRAARLAQARWLLEELRVSLFAQPLGTPVPVSAKRIRALLRP